MNWLEKFRNRIHSPEAAVRHIKSGMRVFMTGNCSVPQHVMTALVDYAPELREVELTQVLAVGGPDYTHPALEGHLRVNSLFISGVVRPAINEGRADFTPCFLSEVPGLFANGILPLDVALIQVSPPDEHGFCSYGVEVGVTKTAAASARLIIAEINDQMPRTLGDSFIHISKIHVIVPVDYPLPEVPMGQINETSKVIGRHVASLIEDGSTLQMGIGAIPDAVLTFLGDKKDLGIHTELFSDGVIDLVNDGVINNEKKTLHPGKLIVGFLLGSRRLYEFVDNNPLLEMHPTEYINDPFVIAQNNKMVAINSAIEVDLTGQVCADSIGPRFFSGVGGQVDFIYGASRSKGGKPIIALPSTAENRHGERFSRIVATLKPGAGVVTTRNHVHYVVTEFGIAHLYGKTIRQRVRALIDIAHPDFREELEQQAHELRWI